MADKIKVLVTYPNRWGGGKIHQQMSYPYPYCSPRPVRGHTETMTWHQVYASTDPPPCRKCFPSAPRHDA
jgi:hypothetical protein